MNSSQNIIHVDMNRVSYQFQKSIIIENSPFDFYQGKSLNHKFNKCFAIIGLLNYTRGILEILKFAENNPDYKFIVIGLFENNNLKNKISNCHNIKVFNYMPQEEVFHLIKDCSGIFSLYDPKIEINRLAASNKLYDAMMLGIPVIVNKEISASEFVKKTNIGFVVDYYYNESWNVLINSNINDFHEKGMNGRNLYLSSYEFSSQLQQRLLPILQTAF